MTDFAERSTSIEVLRFGRSTPLQKILCGLFWIEKSLLHSSTLPLKGVLWIFSPIFHRSTWTLGGVLYIKSSWGRRWTSLTLAQVHLRPGWSTPLRACEERSTSTWPQVYLSWNCTRCTMQSSPPSLRGGLGCIVHRVQFQPNVNKGVAKLARRSVLGYPWVDIGAELVKSTSFLRRT